MAQEILKAAEEHHAAVSLRQEAAQAHAAAEQAWRKTRADLDAAIGQENAARARLLAIASPTVMLQG